MQQAVFPGNVAPPFRSEPLLRAVRATTVSTSEAELVRFRVSQGTRAVLDGLALFAFLPLTPATDPFLSSAAWVLSINGEPFPSLGARLQSNLLLDLPFTWRLDGAGLVAGETQEARFARPFPIRIGLEPEDDVRIAFDPGGAESAHSVWVTVTGWSWPSPFEGDDLRSLFPDRLPE